MDQNIEYKNTLTAKYKEFEDSLNGEKDSALHKIRQAAFQNFSQMNWPTTKEEDWRFTNITPVFKDSYNPVTSYKELNREVLNSSIYSKLDCPALVFVNGIYNASLSRLNELPKQISLVKISDFHNTNGLFKPEDFFRFNRNKNIFTELNTSFASDGIFLSIPHNFTAESPICIINIADSEKESYLIQPRCYILAGKNAQVHIIEQYITTGNSRYLTNSLINFHLADNSVVRYTKLQEESTNAYHFVNSNVEIERGASFSSHLISLGGKLSRNDINVVFKGEGGQASLNGLYMTGGDQHFDVHTSVDHAVPLCTSSEHFKGILDEHSRAVFNGKVFVRPDAQKTNAFQENNNILLSNDALVNTKPQLEIFADDVKCSHGATIGQLDEEALFFLRARGIGKEKAKSILIRAFASEIFKDLKITAVKEYLEKILDNKFNAK
jgi:Fe-S cluster assembly protein SufD